MASSSYGSPIVLTKESGDAVMPNTITAYEMTIPLVTGKMMRNLYIPITAALTTTATNQVYTFPAGRAPVIDGPAAPVFRAGATTVEMAQTLATGKLVIATQVNTLPIRAFSVTAFYA